jgi:uncharacterized membrane protein YphA (DoxX/SURF4 family)
MKSRLLAAAFLAFLLTAILAAPSPANAQGCTLCRDATAGSTPQARKALRLAIPLLGIPAIGIFAGALVLAKRIKPGSSSES